MHCVNTSAEQERGEDCREFRRSPWLRWDAGVITLVGGFQRERAALPGRGYVHEAIIKSTGAVGVIGFSAFAERVASLMPVDPEMIRQSKRLAYLRPDADALLDDVAGRQAPTVDGATHVSLCREAVGFRSLSPEITRVRR